MSLIAGQQQLRGIPGFAPCGALKAVTARLAISRACSCAVSGEISAPTSSYKWRRRPWCSPGKSCRSSGCACGDSRSSRRYACADVARFLRQQLTMACQKREIAPEKSECQQQGPKRPKMAPLNRAADDRFAALPAAGRRPHLQQQKPSQAATGMHYSDESSSHLVTAADTTLISRKYTSAPSD